MPKFRTHQLNKVKPGYSTSYTYVDINVPLAQDLFRHKGRTGGNLLKSMAVTHENYLGDDRGKVTSHIGGGSKGIKYENQGWMLKLKKDQRGGAFSISKSILF